MKSDLMDKSHRLFSYLLAFSAIIVSFSGCGKDGSPAGSAENTDNKYFTTATKEYSVTKAEIADMVVSQIPSLKAYSSVISNMLCDVDIAVIQYKTTNVDGSTVEASGVVAIPKGKESYDHIVSIQHGTSDMEDAPSLERFPFEMAPVVRGHVVVMADYLGYGKSRTDDRQHPYLHIKYTGIPCADMIEAAREYLASKNIKETKDNIQLVGYSQGGQATVATLLELEDRGEAGRIQGVYAGGGPYDLEATMKAMIAGNSYDHLGFVPYLIRGIEYGEQLSLDDSKIYAPEVISGGLYEMFATKPLSDWHSALGTDITKVLNSDFFVTPGYNGNSDIQKLMAAVDGNSLVNHVPKTFIALYHSRTDDYVPYVNAVNAHAAWSDSSLTDLVSDGHIMGGVEFMLRYMGIWDMVSPMITTATKAELDAAIPW